MTRTGLRASLLVAVVAAAAGCSFHPGAQPPAPTPEAGAPDAPLQEAAYNFGDGPPEVGAADVPSGAADAPAGDASAEKTCVPLSCSQPGGTYCGDVPDGCGGLKPCGDCPMGQMCGAGGTPHVCGGDSTCKPIPCTGANYSYCGRIGDGCGHALECGDCAGSKKCGAVTPNVCG